MDYMWTTHGLHTDRNLLTRLHGLYMDYTWITHGQNPLGTSGLLLPPFCYISLFLSFSALLSFISKLYIVCYDFTLLFISSHIGWHMTLLHGSLPFLSLLSLFLPSYCAPHVLHPLFISPLFHFKAWTTHALYVLFSCSYSSTLYISK